jgi:anti-sigma B factor antagonist
MTLVVSDLSGVTKAELKGRLDTANVNELELRFTAMVLPQARPTIVDLTDVTFIASLGIRMLLTAARGLSRRGVKLVMYGASPAVLEILETTAISEIIPVLVSEADAIAAVNS